MPRHTVTHTTEFFRALLRRLCEKNEILVSSLRGADSPVSLQAIAGQSWESRIRPLSWDEVRTAWRSTCRLSLDGLSPGVCTDSPLAVLATVYRLSALGLLAVESLREYRCMVVYPAALAHLFVVDEKGEVDPEAETALAKCFGTSALAGEQH